MGAILPKRITEIHASVMNMTEPVPHDAIVALASTGPIVLHSQLQSITSRAAAVSRADLSPPAVLNRIRLSRRDPDRGQLRAVPDHQSGRSEM